MFALIFQYTVEKRIRNNCVAVEILIRALQWNILKAGYSGFWNAMDRKMRSVKEARELTLSSYMMAREWSMNRLIDRRRQYDDLVVYEF